ncbi:PA14 domain-containing protein [Rhodocytophaga aerolata]|uniref:PA14 domain-containing protein n=1 Tax=Rhodocytophaga aerolata TaxID=455078 RepID=A0ABT8R6D2_9BACT|nr:PA14 domain-containing protein [Rhodocytophaga aerolata]MDO1447665.1 PA14 domain-containing protein [Rhodocytophaga aerolata]
MAQEFSLQLQYTPQLTDVNGTAFFPAYTPDFGNELWKSNGTSAGTVRVKNLLAGYSEPSGDLYNLTRVGNSLFFIAQDMEGKNALWKSDGTAQGTVKLKVITEPGNFYQFTDVNGVLYFIVEKALGIYDLWKSDGTAAGTLILKSFESPTGGTSFPYSFVEDIRLVNGNGTLYFTAIDYTYGLELWKSNGTSAGTVLVKDIRPGPGFSGITSLAYWNGNLYFDANDGGAAGLELWKSNGTASGTVMVKDIAPNQAGSADYAGSYPKDFKVYNGALYFVASGSFDTRNPYQNQNRELWKTDGTAQGTVLVKDIAPGLFGSHPSQLTISNGTLFFVADHDRASATEYAAGELWKTDGTTQGTVLVKDIAPGAAGSVPVELTDVNGVLYFAADKNGISDGYTAPSWELWKSNGTAQGTVLVKEVVPTDLLAVNGSLLFATTANQLWKSDGTAAGTMELKVHIPPATCSATGGLSREYWANVSGTTVSTIPLTSTPTSSTQLTSFETPSGIGDNYGQRLRGFICAPYSGNYTFYVASDDHSELWLSNNENPEGKQKIASVTGYASPKQWTKYASQKSATIYMERGYKYYIEALHKEGAGGDHLAVAWTTPGSNAISVISGASLSPYVENKLPVVTITSPVNGEKIPTSPASLTVTATASDADGSVNRVEFYADNGSTSFVEYDYTAPYSVTWNDAEAGTYRISARVVDNQDGYSELAEVTVTVDGLPEPWAGSDVGTPLTKRGSSGYRNGVFTLKSAGNDFYRAPDDFYYVYQPLNGNVAIVAKVESLQNTHPNALAGIMIREHFGTDASFVATAVNPSGNTNFMWRQESSSPGYKSVPGTAPRWLKLERNGNSFTSSYSSDGVNWTAIGQTTINMGSDIYVGLALTSQNSSSFNTATFSNVSITSPAMLACSATGSILREYWANVRGGAVTDIPVNTVPASSTQLTSFETPSGIGDNYGQRIRGYICPSVTGNYTFYLASDDQGELWLSTNDNPASKQKIAYITGHAASRQWTKFPTQKSVEIALEKGKKYYIEALHKESVYGDNLAVGWTLPGSTSIQVLPGSVLSPVVPAARIVSEQDVEEILISAYPNPFSDKLTIATQGQQGKVIISLTDVVGKTYFIHDYSLSGQAELSLDFSALQLKAGMHLLKLQSEDGKIQVIKVVKK